MDIEVIKEELVASGYLKQKRSKKNRRQAASKPEHFIASDGNEILVGKEQSPKNDQLTLKQARKTDIWLHAKNIPGSHVIIKNDQPSEETLTEAAELAAYFSKFRANQTSTCGLCRR